MGQRLGVSNGRSRNPAEVVALVVHMSGMLAVRLRRLSTAFLTEAGSVIVTLMDAASKQFAIQLLLPWVQKIGLLETGKGVRRVPHRAT